MQPTKLSCNRIWGLMKQKVSPRYVLSHPFKIVTRSHISIDRFLWLGYKSLTRLPAVCTDGHSYNSHGLIIWLAVTLYDTSNNKVAKLSSHWCQLILAVEDGKLDKPDFLFQCSRPEIDRGCFPRSGNCQRNEMVAWWNFCPLSWESTSTIDNNKCPLLHQQFLMLFVFDAT